VDATKSTKEGRKELKALDKAITPVISEFNPKINLNGRHAFVVLTISEDDEGLSMALHKVDRETMTTGDPIEALMKGGATGFVATKALNLLKGQLEDIGNMAISANRFSDLLDSVFEKVSS
jgi:hypothetical protein